MSAQVPETRTYIMASHPMPSYSAKDFSNEVRTGLTLRDRTAAGTSSPYLASRSKMTNLGADPNGNASRNCWTIHELVGCFTAKSDLRPKVQNAMRALREMQPFAREREIETGRYSHFSPEERELLRKFKLRRGISATDLKFRCEEF